MMTIPALLAVLVLALLTRSGLSALFASWPVTEDEHMYLRWLAQLAQYAFLLWAPVLAFKLRPAGLARLAGPLPGWRACGVAASYGVVLLVFTWSETAVETLVVAQFDPRFAWSLWVFDADVPPASYGPGEWIAMILMSVVLAPVVEETFFRGLFVPTLRTTRGMHAAAIFSSCLFTLVHYPKLYLVSTLVFSLALAYLYMRSGSLLLCIAVHGGFNAATLVLENPGWQLLARMPKGLDRPGAWALELALFVASSAILLHAFFRYRPAVVADLGKLDRHRSYSAQ